MNYLWYITENIMTSSNTMINLEAVDKGELLNLLLKENITVNGILQSMQGWMNALAKNSIHNIGDICYWNGTALCYTPYTLWESSLGTPLAICVIPSRHSKYWDDGKARFIGIKPITSAGTSASTEQTMKWATASADTSLTNYTYLPTWNNVVGGTTSSAATGHASSDRFTGGTANVVDTSSWYSSTTNMIPSPLIGSDGGFYSDYMRTITGNNPLSDFNGLTNTTTLGASASTYVAANACKTYSTDGISAGNWYLPACGELAYILARFNVINSALTACGGVVLSSSANYWSSTEYSKNYVYNVSTSDGLIGYAAKASTYVVRPFVMFQ